jgi:hypothetical protein
LVSALASAAGYLEYVEQIMRSPIEPAGFKPIVLTRVRIRCPPGFDDPSEQLSIRCALMPTRWELAASVRQLPTNDMHADPHSSSLNAFLSWSLNAILKSERIPRV